MSGEQVALAGTEGTELGHDRGFYSLQVGGTFPRTEPAAGEGEITDAPHWGLEVSMDLRLTMYCCVPGVGGVLLENP